MSAKFAASHNLVVTAVALVACCCTPALSNAQDTILSQEFQSLDEYEVISDPSLVSQLNSIVLPSLWTVTAGTSAPILTNDQVNHILNLLPQSSLGSACDFQFTNATNDSQYELIVVSDPNGRGSCNAYSVLRGGATSWTWQPFIATEIPNLEVTIVDLNSNGIPELLIPQIYALGEGGSSRATWTSIYSWNSAQKRYIPSDEKFSSFYTSRLATLNGLISQDATDTADPPNIVARDNSSHYMERDRILRFLGTDPNAGLSLALSWAQSSDDLLRYRAIVILAELGGAQATQALQTLSHDSNQFVADQATQALNPTITGDLNGDGQVDSNDLNILDSFLNTSVTYSKDPRDLNHDSVINALDARILTTFCTYPRCATHP